MRVAASVYELILGLVLCLVPWSRVWQDNWLIWMATPLEPWLQSAVTRGAISGLGAAFLLCAGARLLGLPLVTDDEPGLEVGDVPSDLGSTAEPSATAPRLQAREGADHGSGS